MNGTESTKNKKIIELICKSLGSKLSAIISAGSFGMEDYKVGWSDIDLLIVVDNLDFEIKTGLSEIKQVLEYELDILFGINCITLDQTKNPVLATKSFDGKTLQALHELKFNSDRLMYSNGLALDEIYAPNRDEVREYSLCNVNFFLLRNRKELIPGRSSDLNTYKNRLRKEIRACFTITKLAVQYFEDIEIFEHKFIIKKAGQIFTGFDFKILNNSLDIIKNWSRINDLSYTTDLFKQIDKFIEEFVQYFNGLVVRDHK